MLLRVHDMLPVLGRQPFFSVINHKTLIKLRFEVYHGADGMDHESLKLILHDSQIALINKRKIQSEASLDKKTIY